MNNVQNNARAQYLFGHDIYFLNSFFRILFFILKMEDLMNVMSKREHLPQKFPSYEIVLDYCQICLNTWLFLLLT